MEPQAEDVSCQLNLRGDFFIVIICIINWWKFQVLVLEPQRVYMPSYIQINKNTRDGDQVWWYLLFVLYYSSYFDYTAQ